MLHWKEPTENGGTEITGYYVERCLAGTSRWLRITKEPVTTREYLAEEFVEGNEYCFRIIALNKVGEGPPGPSSQVVEAKDPWSKYILLIILWKEPMQVRHYMNVVCSF